MRRTRQHKNSGPTRYAIYLRCSSDDQAHGDFTTIDSQRDKNTKFVMSKGGIIVKVYIDEGKTGTNLNRPGYRDMLRDANSGQFEVVVTTYGIKRDKNTLPYAAQYRAVSQRSKLYWDIH